MLWQLILGAFGVPLAPFLWFRGVLEMGWNFDVFWDLPLGRPRLREVGPVNFHQQQLADLKTAIRQDTRPADRQLGTGCQKTGQQRLAN